MRGTARRCLLMLIAVCAMAAGGAVLRGAQAPAESDADLAEGQRLFEELDYEHAVPLLSRAISRSSRWLRSSRRRARRS